jgi:hypothetical protein
MPEQVAVEIDLRVCFSGPAVGVWALRFFRPVIIEGVGGLICVRGTKTAVGSAVSIVLREDTESVDHCSNR